MQAVRRTAVLKACAAPSDSNPAVLAKSRQRRRTLVKYAPRPSCVHCGNAGEVCG